MPRTQFKPWVAPLATLQAKLAEGEAGIASETGLMYRRPDGLPTAELRLVCNPEASGIINESAFKTPVKAATVSALAADYLNGASGVGATLTASVVPAVLENIDGIVPSINMRILVAAQENSAHNGIYIVTNLGNDEDAGWQLTRSVDANNTDRIAGAIVPVDQGLINGGQVFKTEFKSNWTLGTSACSWMMIPLDSPFKEEVYCATVVDLGSVIYSNGTNGVGATLTSADNRALSVDGSAAPIGRRVLVRAQKAPAQNGIYVVADPGDNESAPFVLQRAIDCNTPSKMSGATVSVDRGTLYGGRLFKTNFSSAGVIGTTSVNWNFVATVTPWKESVRHSSTANLDVVYSNGTSGVGATITATANGALSSLDGVSPVVGNRVLVRHQTNAYHNGIYIVTDLGSVSTPWEMMRAADADAIIEVLGMTVSVEYGAIGGGRSFKCTTTGGTMGGTDITFVEIVTSTPMKISAKLATTSPLPLCDYNNGVSGRNATLTARVNGALGAIDGVSMPASKRLLVMNQANPVENGIYVTNSIGSVSTKWQLTRVTDANTPAALSGAIVSVEEGDTNVGRLFKTNFGSSSVIGSSQLNFNPIIVSSPFKEPVVAATIEPIEDCVYAHGTNGNGASLKGSVNGVIPSIDGVANMPKGSRVLVMSQLDAWQNGIYIVTNVGSPTTKWEMIRAPDANNGRELTGAVVLVESGSTMRSALLKCSRAGSGNITEGEKSVWTYLSGPVSGAEKLPVVSCTSYPMVTSVKSGDDWVVTHNGAAGVTYDNGSGSLDDVWSAGIGATLTATVNGRIGQYIADEWAPFTMRSRIEGAHVSLGSRILVNGQLDPRQNGIYVITNLGSETTKWSMRRAPDANSMTLLSASIVRPRWYRMHVSPNMRCLTHSVAPRIGVSPLIWGPTNTGQAMVRIASDVDVDGTYANFTVEDDEYTIFGPQVDGAPGMPNILGDRDPRNYSHLGIGATLTGPGGGVSLVVAGNTMTSAHHGWEILLVDQNNPVENGIYTLLWAGSPTTPWVLMRSPGHCTAAQLDGCIVSVRSADNVRHRGRVFRVAMRNGAVGTGLIFVEELQAYSALKEAVRGATTAALPECTYTNGPTAGQLGCGAKLTATANGALSFDGLSPTKGQRVLVKNQAEEKHNGVYVVVATGSASAPWVLVRAADCNSTAGLCNAIVPCDRGTVNKGETFVCRSLTQTGVELGEATQPDVLWYSITTSETAVSDRRLKSDIVEIEDALGRLSRMHGYTFTMGTSGLREAGVIAQEVQEAIVEGTVDVPGGFIGVKDRAIIGLLVQAVNELRQQVEDLRSGCA